MYSVSAACKNAINNYSREFKGKVYIDNNEIYSGDVISFEINEGIVAGNDFELGGAVASTLELKINNIHGEYDNIRLNGKEVKIHLGVVLANSIVEYVPMGIFIIDEAVKDKGIINIEATDKMLILEDYYESKLTYPTTVLEVLKEICSIAKITLATKQFYNSNYRINNKLFDVTLRDVVHDIAEIAGGFAKINRIGDLEIITPRTTIATEINKDRYIDLQIKEGFYVDNLTIVENYFPVDPVPINLNVLPFNSKWQGDFSIDTGDKVRLNDGKGTYETIITKQKISFNGGLRYESECTGLSEQQKSTQQISNSEKTNKRYRSEIKQLADEISTKVSRGDAESIAQQTVDGFKDTVEKDYLSKNDAGNTYTTKSEFNHTSEKVEMNFEATASGNLISCGRVNKHSLSRGWTNSCYTYGTDEYVYIDTYNSLKSTELTNKRFEVSEDEKYTVRFKCAYQSNVKGVTVYIRYFNNENDDNYSSYEKIGEYSNGNNIWKYDIKSFITPHGVKYAELAFVVTTKSILNSDRNFYVTECMCMRGDKLPLVYVPAVDELVKGKTIITGDGVKIIDGALEIQNNAGESVLKGDSYGDLMFTGRVFNHNGSFGVAIDNQGLELSTSSSNNGEEIVGGLRSSVISGSNMNGIELTNTTNGDYIQISSIDDSNFSTGGYGFSTLVRFVPRDNLNLKGTEKKGSYYYYPIFLNADLKLGKGRAITFAGDTSYESIITQLTNGGLGIFADNFITLGYRNASTNSTRIKLYETPPAGTGDQIESWGNWNFKGYILHSVNIRNYTLANTYANTEARAVANVTVLESTEGDDVRYIYKKVSTKNNKAVLSIPNAYKGYEYTIISIVKNKFGDYSLTEYDDYFIVETDKEMILNIEVSIQRSVN